MTRRALAVLCLMSAAAAMAAVSLKPSTPASPAAPPAAPAKTGAAAPESPARPVLYGKSRIGFSVRQMNVPVAGEFRRFKARVNLDPDRPDTSSADVEVDIGSLTMGDEEADAEALKKPWLDAAGFPKAVFRSSAVRVTGKDHFDVEGTLTLKGRPRVLTVPVTVQPLPDGSTQVAGGLTINRTDFGVGGGEWNQDDVVANEVPVKFLIVLGVAPAAGTAAHSP